ncbi:hypothetical protein ACFV2N_45650 [Streptomyces sp. NPDC059680]|uniref:hypothetical protein n=1 Tax=Streptomyces sp. NPDC059680 TaxID=3346904 RepID=UPI00368ACBDD
MSHVPDHSLGRAKGHCSARTEGSGRKRRWPGRRRPGLAAAGIQNGDGDLVHAKTGTPQAHSFTEPQIHAWYQLTDTGLVKPLNKEARTCLQGRNSLPLAACQKLVHERYGDKLPGSEYDRKGLAGGYPSHTTANRTSPSKPVDPAPSTDTSVQLTGLAATQGLMAVGGAIYIRMRRTVTRVWCRFR